MRRSRANRDNSARMSTAVLSGVFALAGVMVGGVVNLRVALWQEQRREAREVRPVARLVMLELGHMQAVLFADAHREPGYRITRKSAGSR